MGRLILFTNAKHGFAALWPPAFAVVNRSHPINVWVVNLDGDKGTFESGFCVNFGHVCRLAKQRGR